MYNNAGDLAAATYNDGATGLHRWDGGWVETDPEVIVGLDGEGLGRNAGLSVRFAPNINTAGAWTPLPSVPGTGSILTLTDPSASSDRGFYRVSEQ